MRALDSVAVALALPLTFALGLAASTALVGCGGSIKVNPTTSPAHAGHDPSGAPDWIPPYTPAQNALLRDSGETPVQVPVRRIYPDLSRFGYASNHRMDDPTESLKFTRMVATIVTESPRFYVITEAPPDVQNAVVQYGPSGSAEADGWRQLVWTPEGIGKLVPAPLGDEAKADYERFGGDDWRKHKTADATATIAAFKAAVLKSPLVAGGWLTLADVYVEAGETAKAEEAYKSVVTIDDSIATGHIGLAEIAEKRGDMTVARRELAEALAYHPSSKRAKAMADRITNGRVKDARIKPYKVFLDVTDLGAVRVAATGGIPGQTYGSCRAIMRYEPEVRAAIFEQEAEAPYFLSVVEEVVCLEAAIGAYLFERHDSDAAPKDATVEQLFELARSEGLLGYAMFEILGQHRPERARTAPPDVHQAVVDYVTRHVLGEGEPLPDGVYSAMLSR